MAELKCYTNAIVLLVLLMVSRVFSVQITCPSSYKVRYCKVSGIESIQAIDRQPTNNEDFFKTCYLNDDFGVVSYEDGYYLWVRPGCGGLFVLTNNNNNNNNNVASGIGWNAWGNWEACNAFCGGGTQTRHRTCSSRDNRDCFRVSGESSVESRACNTEICQNGIDQSWTNQAFCGVGGLTDGYKIVGGDKAENCQFPWMVLVYVHTRSAVCGGSIIDNRHVMTAAHCMFSTGSTPLQDRPEDLRILTGSSEMPFTRSQDDIPGLRVRTASRIKVHEEYNPRTITNDIGIITLSKPILFDRCHVPVCLAPIGTQSEGLTCKTMGWGKTSNSPRANVASYLQYTKVKVIDASRCVSLYGQRYFHQASNLCVDGYGTGSCQGDSGGPLVCKQNGRYYAHGIVSSGAKGQCGTLPSQFTDVSHFLDWITANTRS